MYLHGKDSKITKATEFSSFHDIAFCNICQRINFTKDYSNNQCIQDRCYQNKLKGTYLKNLRCNTVPDAYLSDNFRFLGFPTIFVSYEQVQKVKNRQQIVCKNINHLH